MSISFVRVALQDLVLLPIPLAKQKFAIYENGLSLAFQPLWSDKSTLKRTSQSLERLVSRYASAVRLHKSELAKLR